MPAQIAPKAWLRPVCVAVFGLGLLAGCDRHPVARMAMAPAVPSPMAASAAEPPQEKNWFRPGPQQGPGVHLAYTHTIGLQVGGGALRAHFAAARDRCLTSPALHCILMQASIEAQPTPDDSTQAPLSAALRLRLPHDQVGPFVNGLTDSLPGEAPGLAHVLRQATSAEDLGRPLADIAQRTAQLSEYLASLKALGGRLTIGVSDLVKIASETAQAQSQIEAVQAEQRDLSLRVDTETVDIAFEEPTRIQVLPDPIVQTWSQATAIFHASLAEMLAVAIQAAAWLPLALAGLIGLAVLRLVLFGRRRRGDERKARGVVR